MFFILADLLPVTTFRGFFSPVHPSVWKLSIISSFWKPPPASFLLGCLDIQLRFSAVSNLISWFFFWSLTIIKKSLFLHSHKPSYVMGLFCTSCDSSVCHVTLLYVMSTVNTKKKKCFHYTFAKYVFFELHGILPHSTIKILGGNIWVVFFCNWRVSIRRHFYSRSQFAQF